MIPINTSQNPAFVPDPLLGLLEVVDVLGVPRLRSVSNPDTYYDFGNIVELRSLSGYIVPYIDSGMHIGDPNGRHFGSMSSYWWAQKMGATLTAAATIQPTCGAHHITGLTTIDTIDPIFVNNGAGGNGYLRILADTLITWSAAGNITVGGTLAVGLVKTFFWDVGTAKWWPMV